MGNCIVIDWKGYVGKEKQYLIHYYEDNKIFDTKEMFVKEHELQDTLNMFSCAKNLHILSIFERKDIDYED